MPMDLRPLTLGELLDRAFSLYRTHLRTFVAIAAFPAALGGTISALGRVVTMSVRPAAGTPAEPSLSTFAPAFAAMLLLIPSAVVGALAVAAVVGSIGDLYEGRLPSVRVAFDRMRAAIGRVLLLILLTALRLLAVAAVAGCGIAAMFGLARATVTTLGMFGVTLAMLASAGLMLCAFAGMVYLSLRYSLSVPALMIEGISAGAALRRSVALVPGNVGRALIIFVFGLVIGQVVAAILQMPFVIGALALGGESRAAGLLEVLGAFSGAAGSAITSPLMSVALTVLYYDARVRHEALDIHMMLDALDASDAAPGGPGRGRPAPVIAL